MTLDDLNEKANDALSKEPGPTEMVRLAQQFGDGTGDYTAERKQWLQDLNLRDVVREVKRKRKKRR